MNPLEEEEEEPLVFCKLCLSNHPSASTSRLHTCSCVFCTPCLEQYVQLAIREGGGAPITCPNTDCGETIALLDTEIACFAPADQVQLYQRLKFEKGVQLDPSKVWCPVLECQAPCPLRPGSEGNAVPVSCPTCHEIFCCVCYVPWQDGHLCAEHRPLTVAAPEDGVQTIWEADAAIKRCPMCGVYIERNQGCAQMLCKSCKHTFCWYCLQNLDGDIFLRHYDRGPCRNKLGHSRASVVWNRAQVVGILVGVSVVVLVTSPLLLLASPCIVCCICKPCRANKRKKRKKKDVEPESTV